MYIPKSFEVTDTLKLIDFINKNSFGILFSETDGLPFATHLPFLVKERDDHVYLFGHMAKANPHWKQIRDQVLVVFPGPHAYISPAWYEEINTVPTWNYLAVHVYGKFIVIDDNDEMMQVMSDTVDFYESSMPNPWTMDKNDGEFNNGLLKAIVAFKIKINKIEGKWKLNQNHSVERQRNLIKHLNLSDDHNSKEIANLMEQNLKNNVTS